MFETADSLTKDQLISVGHYARLAVEHLLTPEELRRTPILAGIAGEPTREEQEMACRWLEEIEKTENRPINQLDPDTVLRYVGQLSRLVLERTRSENPIDAERGRRLLEDLRRAVPLPSELRLRRTA